MSSRQDVARWIAGPACPVCGSEACEDATHAAKHFGRLEEGRYRLSVPESGVVLDVDRLRRESGALWGELLVSCSLPGAQTYDGTLSAGDLNLSSVTARSTRGKYLAERSRTAEVDWTGLLEELSLRIIAAERQGAPLVTLRDLPRPAPEETRIVDGLPLLARHPMILFGDGGSAKSYLGLYLAGRLEQQGIRTALYDWELCGEDHRDRLERIFGPDMPEVRYHRCAGPLVHVADRIRRDVQSDRLDYVVLDSVAFACDGPPEAAEVAGRYFQALRSVGPVGSLHVAHIAKAEGADKKPFGSTFWHNGARSTWYVKLAEDAPDTGRIRIALYHRKANLGALRPAIGYEITFSEARTAFRRVDVGDTPDLAERLPLRARVSYALRHGAMTVADLADELAVKTDSVKKTVDRGLGRYWTKVPGHDGVYRIGLLDARGQVSGTSGDCPPREEGTDSPLSRGVPCPLDGPRGGKGRGQP